MGGVIPAKACSTIMQYDTGIIPTNIDLLLLLSYYFSHYLSANDLKVTHNQNLVIFAWVHYSNGGVLANSTFGQTLQNSNFNIPDDSSLPGTYCI